MKHEVTDEHEPGEDDGHHDGFLVGKRVDEWPEAIDREAHRVAQDVPAVPAQDPAEVDAIGRADGGQCHESPGIGRPDAGADEGMDLFHGIKAQQKSVE